MGQADSCSSHPPTPPHPSLRPRPLCELLVGGGSHRGRELRKAHARREWHENVLEILFSPLIHVIDSFLRSGFCSLSPSLARCLAGDMQDFQKAYLVK